jgi:hypothetical protein
MVTEELRWENSLEWCRYMCEEHAETKLDNAVYFLQVILLMFQYFYLYLSEKHFFIFSIMALKLTLFLLVWNIFHVCVVFSK